MIHLPWMQIYVGDELAETSHLSSEEYGAHMLLRLHQWQHGSLPTEDERLRRICRVEADRWPFLKDVLAPLFDWQWHHQRTADVRKASEEKHANLSANGKKGGRPRKDEKADGKPMESRAFDRLKANGKADGKQSPSQPQSPSYSDSRSEPQSQSDDRAYEKEGENVDTRETSVLRRFPIPPTAVEGKRFLVGLGVPQSEMERCLNMLMGGHLCPYDIEEWSATAQRGAA
ncbi:DUF1376 domain-containing protein [Sinorhizobium fredii]|uniref:DUF1376 domain-containing protein n=1 Tax=Rhizobium fredii TaxID=380 RepID=UPI00351488B0